MSRGTSVLTLALMLGVASGAWAQVATGNIYGQVKDEQGSVLPGVDVSVVATTIGGAPKTTVTDGTGEFRFLRLDSGTYKILVSLSGFAKVERGVIVTSGVNTNVDFSLKVATVEETVTVTAESPTVDTKKIGTSTTVSREELELTPQSKDPWALLKTVPGVIVDRVNVGGNESGQQSGFVGKGSSFNDTMWTMDGVTITDTDSGGASSSYYDFNAFDEVNITTGGSDLRVQTGGIGINFITRRGTNQFNGTVYGTVADKGLESSNLPDYLVGDPRLQGSDKANHTDNIKNYGFDVGGPILKDRLWFWGSYGYQDIRIRRLTQTKDRTVLKNGAAKVNWRPNNTDDVSFFWFDGAKEKYGRSPGWASNEADSFLWNQGNFYPNGLHGLWKGEVNHVFGPSLFVNAKYAWYGWGYGFAPRGGAEKNATVDYDLDTATGSWVTYKSLKSWHVVDVNGSAFKTVKGAGHELKFGFGYVRRPTTSLTRWSGDQTVGFIYGPDEKYTWVTRERNVAYMSEGYSGFFGDTITKDKLTLNAGVRWDKQSAVNLPSTAAANPAFPQLLPALDFPGNDQQIGWNALSPRLAVTYSLDEAHKTVLRGSYAYYAGQINSFEVTSANPTGTYYTYIAYQWVDSNKDGFVQKGEVLTGLGPEYYNGIDPSNPSSTASANTIDKNYKANRDHEIIAGIDREVMPNFAVGVAYTWRQGNNLISWTPRIGMTSADYTALAPVSARGYTVVPYAPAAALVDKYAGGRTLTNRPDYTRSYSGLEFTANKRFADKWMTRIAFSWNNFTESLDGPGAVQNPTRSDTSGGNVSGPQNSGGQVAPRSGGSGKGDIFYNAKWQLNANALYEFPLGIQLGGSLFGRQGYVRPFVINARAGSDGTIRILATDNIEENRYPSVWDLDLRVAKTFAIYRDTKIELAADIFNVMNSNVELTRNRTLSSGSFDTVGEILSPRIMRIGVRFQF